MTDAEAKAQLAAEAAAIEKTGFATPELAATQAAKPNAARVASVPTSAAPTPSTPAPVATAPTPAAAPPAATTTPAAQTTTPADGRNKDGLTMAEANDPKYWKDGKYVGKETTPADGAPAAQGQAYRIQAGDNLTKIASKFGVSVTDILAANPTIKNPNTIFSGQSLTIPAPSGTQGFKMPTGYEQINGAQFPTTTLQRANFADIRVAPDGTFLYGKRIDPAATLNDQQQANFDIIEGAKEKAGETDKRDSSKESEYQDEIDDILIGDETSDETTATPTDGVTIDLKADDGSLAMYKELLQSPEIKALGKSAAAKQEEIDKLDAAMVALENDIRKEIEGEAPQSYIDAKVAERAKDLYPKKLALTAELRNITSQLSSEKENAANVLQYTLRDSDNRYNRLFSMLQLETQKGQFAKNYEQQERAAGTQKEQFAANRELAILGMMKDLPPGRSITVDGKEYKGMNEDANLSVIQFTDAKHKITVVGIDKTTGEIKYTKVIGMALAKGGGAAVKPLTPTQELANYNATETLDIQKKVDDGTYEVITIRDPKNGSVKSTTIVDSAQYEGALEEWGKGGTKWYRDDETVEHNGKTYSGPAASQPSPLSYEVVPPSRIK